MRGGLTGRRSVFGIRLLAAATLGVVAFALVLAVTDPPGPGLDPDAMAYMGAAESLVARGEYRVPAARWWSADSTAPLTHFPPGYSTALALPVGMGMAPPQAARLLQALAAAVTTATAVLLVAESATLVAGVLLGLALLVTPALELVHVSVLSEPLFLAWMTLLLAVMTRPRTRPIAIGVLAALGALTRYAGVALVGAGALWAFAECGSLAVRLRRAMWALLPALLLQGVWVARTNLLHEPDAIRHFALYGALGPTVVQGGATMRDWLVPDAGAWSDPMPHQEPIALAAALVALVLLTVGTRRAVARWRTVHDGNAARLLAACALLAACYLGMVAVSRLIADPAIPLDERILAPVILLASIALATSMALWWQSATHMVPRLALAVALGGWWVAAAATTLGAARYTMEQGSDFAGEPWRRSELLAWARASGASHPLYSNWPAALYFHLHRPTRYLPGVGDTNSLAAFADTLRVRDGRALVFDVPDADYLTRAPLLRAAGLRVVVELQDGVVLAARARP